MSEERLNDFVPDKHIIREQCKQIKALVIQNKNLKNSVSELRQAKNALKAVPLSGRQTALFNQEKLSLKNKINALEHKNSVNKRYITSLEKIICELKQDIAELKEKTI